MASYTYQGYNFQLKLNDFCDDTILTVAIAHWLLGERSEESLRRYLLEYALRYTMLYPWVAMLIPWILPSPEGPYL